MSLTHRVHPSSLTGNNDTWSTNESEIALNISRQPLLILAFLKHPEGSCLTDSDEAPMATFAPLVHQYIIIVKHTR